MLIARSTISRASTWKGNRPCETAWPLRGKEGWFLLTTKERALVKRTRFSLVTQNRRPISLSGVVKSAICGEVTCTCSRKVDRGGWGERALKEQRQVPGDPLEQGSSGFTRKVLRRTAETGNLQKAEGRGVCSPQMRNGRYKTRVSPNYFKEYITWNGFKRKSDRLVVAKKRGNALGAKGPSFSRVSIKIERAA